MPALLTRAMGVNSARTQALAFHNRERRRNRQLQSEYANQISAGGTAVAGVAGSYLSSTNSLGFIKPLRLGVSKSVAVTGGNVLFIKTGRTVQTPALAADQIHNLGWFGVGDWEVQNTVAGVVTLWLLGDWHDQAFPLVRITF